MSVEFEIVQVENPNELNLIFGQSHFIKTVEDIYECLISSAMGIKFGVAFCEASGPCLIRKAGNDDELVELAVKNAQKIGCGHSFIIFLKNAFPINVLHALRTVPEIVNFYCATANSLQVIVAKTAQGRGVSSVIDGFAPKGVEGEKETQERKDFLRMIGYKCK
ncbi:hypothetical protein TVAG_487100 [Trichomonas vaginalis G3]|uniref:Adenosine monophosphate-protein transferase n=1 Tax=Trichomonas vaginalis (strain ATCC PRA-98 / G3) TaxID=412133 RepID=A2DZD8_TRIV3|nr:adenosine specific kinase family [Trichomonas vaginalis G3]EAY14267.1 hypothetical protein TVAG_487100 [Trichomonas vaginalis G3]KAI5491872.1 adenosine specific kinase family [Trichomonas vaginalis G3]|eukprot:XP_001326490.1 hypothetical protein [Trichomonas vaginalis G3]